MNYKFNMDTRGLTDQQVRDKINSDINNVINQILEERKKADSTTAKSNSEERKKQVKKEVTSKNCTKAPKASKVIKESKVSKPKKSSEESHKKPTRYFEKYEKPNPRKYSDVYQKKTRDLGDISDFDDDDDDDFVDYEDNIPGFVKGIITFIAIIVAIICFYVLMQAYHEIEAQTDRSNLVPAYSCTEAIRTRNDTIEKFIMFIGNSAGDSATLDNLKQNQEEYNQVDFQDFNDYQKANQKYITSLVNYMNYVASSNPDCINETTLDYAKKIQSENQEVLSELEDFNVKIAAYNKKWDSYFYSIAAEDKGYRMVQPFDTEDYYTEDLKPAWQLVGTTE